MNKKDKITFVKNLTASIRDEIISKIKLGRIPEDWDGQELREILADKFDNERYFRDKRDKRAREYQNTVICENL